MDRGDCTLSPCSVNSSYFYGPAPSAGLFLPRKIGTRLVVREPEYLGVRHTSSFAAVTTTYRLNDADRILSLFRSEGRSGSRLSDGVTSAYDPKRT